MTLEEAVAGTRWGDLLPAHRSDGDDQPVGAPRCVDALALADGISLAVVADDRDHVYPTPLRLDRGVVRRAQPGDGAAEALVRLLGQGRPDRGDFRVTTWHHASVNGERAITVDQTNESIVVGDAAVVKWAFLADTGPHPAPSLLSLLDRAGFTGTPTPWGALEWQGRLLALVVAYVPDAVDGWTWAVEDVCTLDTEVAEASGRAVGSLVGSFHEALASTRRPAAAAESITWRERALADLDRALAVTSGAAHGLVSSHARQLRETFRSMPTGEVPVQRVHGDLHVGQVLRGWGYWITDFDGNPVVPAAERIKEQPVALDVAGMAQSLTHAGIVVQRHHPDLDPAAVARTAAVARSAFLTAYGEADPGLVRAFSLQQVCREFIYAATHLPRWSYVPETALPLLLAEEDE